MRFSVSSSSFWYPLIFLRTSSIWLRLLPRRSDSSVLPLLSFFYLFFNNVCQKAFPTQDVTNPASLPSFYGMYDIPLLLDCVLYFFILHKVGPTNLLYPSPAQHFKTVQVFLIYLSKCASFSTIQNYVPSVVLY